MGILLIQGIGGAVLIIYQQSVEESIAIQDTVKIIEADLPRKFHFIIVIATSLFSQLAEVEIKASIMEVMAK